ARGYVCCARPVRNGISLCGAGACRFPTHRLVAPQCEEAGVIRYVVVGVVLLGLLVVPHAHWPSVVEPLAAHAAEDIAGIEFAQEAQPDALPEFPAPDPFAGTDAAGTIDIS